MWLSDDRDASHNTHNFENSNCSPPPKCPPLARARVRAYTHKDKSLVRHRSKRYRDNHRDLCNQIGGSPRAQCSNAVLSLSPIGVWFNPRQLFHNAFYGTLIARTSAEYWSSLMFDCNLFYFFGKDASIDLIAEILGGSGNSFGYEMQFTEGRCMFDWRRGCAPM